MIEVTIDTRARLGQLQALRFAAALAVVLYHLFGTFGAKQNAFSIGASGVDIFFVLSGFVIAYSAFPRAEPANFVMRRLARIVPLYWALTLAIAAMVLLFPRLFNSTTFSGINLLKSLFFIPYEKENGLVQPMLFLGWTLNYEMFFYALFASTLLFPNWSPIYPCALVVSLVALGRVVAVDSVVFRFYTDPIMLEFVFGIVLCLLWRFDSNFVRRHAVHFLLAFVALAAVSLFVEAGLFRPFIQGIAALGLVAAMLSVTMPKKVWAAALLIFGNASYSLYLSHPYVIQIYSNLIGIDSSIPIVTLGAVATLALCIALSVALYFLLEVRAQNWITGQWNAWSATSGRSHVTDPTPAKSIASSEAAARDL
jgi:peptidoglycan/LPS O-acetylase OafA/YrhL